MLLLSRSFSQRMADPVQFRHGDDNRDAVLQLVA
jgi:hypothetical protein